MSNNISGLQSRTAKRRNYLRMMEDKYTEQKGLGLILHGLIGMPKREALAPARKIRQDIKVVAQDQKLDRDILKELHDQAAEIRYLQFFISARG
jgi:hypothetical protein